jgi:hypothetical protein
MQAAKGETLHGSVYIDQGNVFEYTLVYVALSRGTSPDSIMLSRRVTVNDLRVISLQTFYDSYMQME